MKRDDSYAKPPGCRDWDGHGPRDALGGSPWAVSCQHGTLEDPPLAAGGLHRLAIVALGLGAVLLIGCVGPAPVSRRVLNPAAGGPSKLRIVASSRSQVDSGAPELRVMSLNVRTQNAYDAVTGNSWRLRKTRIAKVVREFVPDILSTQELEGGQATDLQDQMPKYGFVGAGRNDGHSGEMCGVFYRRNRLTKLGSGHFWLSDEPEVPGSSSWGARHRRIATWLKLRRRSDGRVVFVFNTHFDHASKLARCESSRLIRAKMGEIAGGAPVIITGDFNADEASEPYRALLGGESGVDQRLEDSYRHQHARSPGGEGTYHGFNGSTSGGRIDWIMCTPHFHVCDAMIHHDEVDGKFPSDHFPISAVFRLGK